MLLAFFVFCDLSEKDLSFLFKSDALYLPSIYKDLYIDGNTFRGWHVNPAPNFFPDMPLFFLLNLCSGSFILATIMYGVIQVGLTSLLLYLLIKKVDANYHLNGLFLNLMLMTFLLVHFADGHFAYSFQLLINGYHYSAFLSALLCFNFVFSFLKSKNRRWLFLIVIFGSFAIASDRLFIVTFSAPALALAAGLMFNRRKAGVWVLLAVILTSYTGLELYEFILRQGYIKIPEPHKFMDFENIKQSWFILVGQLGDWLSLTKLKGWILIGAMVSFVIMLINVVLQLPKIVGKKAQADYKSLFVFLTATFILTVFIAPVLNGSYTGWDTMRYNFSSYIVSLSLLPVAVGLFLKPRSIPKWVFSLATVVPIAIVVVVYLGLPNGGFSKTTNYYPPRVEAVDQVAEKFNLQYGIAPYNDAKVITMFSKKKLKVYTVFDGLTPWFHVTNHNWFYKKVGGWNQDVTFDFVLAKNKEARNATRQLLGPNLDSVSVSEWTLYKTDGFTFPNDGVHWEPLLSGRPE